MRTAYTGFLVFFLLVGGYALGADQVPPPAKGEGDASGKVSVVPTDEGVGLGPRQGSPPPLRGQEAKGASAAQLTHAVAALMGKEVIKHWVDVALHDPDPRAEMRVFMEDVVNAVTAEEVELVIRFLENENVQPSDWKAALVPLSGVMSLKKREAVVEYLQYPVIKTWAVEQLKQIHLFKMAQKAEKRSLPVSRGEENTLR